MRHIENKPKPYEKILPFLFAAALASSCIDNAYDLSNVNTDDVTIGDEDSEYRLPLATVYVSMSELNEGGADIKTLFDEADIWLPSPLPGNAAYVDLRELQNTPETITPLLDALIDQMMDDDAKITAVADLLAEKYLSTFLPLLPPNTDPADFKPVFIEAFRNMPMLHDRLSGEVKSLAGSYLTELKVQDVPTTSVRSTSAATWWTCSARTSTVKAPPTPKTRCTSTAASRAPCP